MNAKSVKFPEPVRYANFMWYEVAQTEKKPQLSFSPQTDNLSSSPTQAGRSGLFDMRKIVTFPPAGHVKPL